MSAPTKAKTRAIVFDADDTLWDTQPLYDEAKSELFGLLESLGFERAKAAAKFTEIDIANVEHFGLSRARFPKSMRDTVESLYIAAGMLPAPHVIERVTAIAERVFARTPIVRTDASAALSLLKSHYQLVLFTAGDEDVQRVRVHQSGLESFFDLVRVTPKKTNEAWLKLIAEERLVPHSSWSVGNSVKSDINPALWAGLRCILVSGGSWEFEQTALEPNTIMDQPWQATTLLQAATIVLQQDGLTSLLNPKPPNR